MNHENSQPGVSLDGEPAGRAPAFVAPQSAADLVRPRRSVLAIWTLVVNLFYYTLPLLFTAALIVVLATSSNSGNSLSFHVGAILAVIVACVVLCVAGLTAFILNTIYLVRIRPIGAKRVLAIISMCLIGLGAVPVLRLFLAFSQ